VSIAGDSARQTLDLAAGGIIEALADVVAERERQDDKWDEQNHEPPVWLAILTEEVGELATAMLRWGFPAHHHRSSADMRAEAVHVAAVAVAFVEYLDRHREVPA